MKKIIEHITPVGGNVFEDMVFPPEETAALKADADRVIGAKLKRSAEFVQQAVA